VKLNSVLQYHLYIATNIDEIREKAAVHQNQDGGCRHIGSYRDISDIKTYSKCGERWSKSTEKAAILGNQDGRCRHSGFC